MASLPKKQNPIGKDGMTKQQRYVASHRVEVRAANAIRMRNKRQEKKASKDSKTEDQWAGSSDGTYEKVMKDEEIDATEGQGSTTISDSQEPHGHLKVMKDEEIDATQGRQHGRLNEENGCATCKERVLSCNRCESILRQNTPLEEFVEIKRLLEGFRAHVLEVAMDLQGKLAETISST
ncbi:hypothetical protein CPB84DRAFT_1755014 [Gymnopilus junonius]|uniref:Uncharacterized protein n=1 Tax=Gymnopilus junonius TaxID=109634 RepID=A0A9P5N9A8_GYMJU|nr:hypothetical protein CPB84DRAFT_1755014 [Gymnopilus junonius]